MVREMQIVQYEKKTIGEWIEDIQKNGYERIWTTRKKREDGSMVIIASNLLACFVLHGELSTMQAIRNIWSNIPLSGFTPAMLNDLHSGKFGAGKGKKEWKCLTRNSIYAYIIKPKAGRGNVETVDCIPDTFAAYMLAGEKYGSCTWTKTGIWPEEYKNFLKKYSV